VFIIDLTEHCKVCCAGTTFQRVKKEKTMMQRIRLNQSLNNTTRRLLITQKNVFPTTVSSMRAFHMNHIYNQQPQQQQHVAQQPNTPPPQATKPQHEQQQEETQQQPEQPKTLMDKVKLFIRKYGITGVVVYFTIYYLTWLSFYVALQEKWLGAGDVMEFAKKYGLEKYLDTEDTKNKKVANIGLAWLITKFTEPVRFAATILVTPYVLRLFQRVVARR
jgi:hypothetical protein